MGGVLVTQALTFSKDAYYKCEDGEMDVGNTKGDKIMNEVNY